MLIKQNIEYYFSGCMAKKYGIRAALIFNRIAWSINFHEQNRERYANEYFVDGHWWMTDTAESLARHFDGLISVRSVKEVIRDFEDDGLLIGRKIGKTTWDQTKWYAVNLEKYEKLHREQPEEILADISTADGNPEMHSAISALSRVQELHNEHSAISALSSSLISPTESHPKNQERGTTETVVPVLSASRPPKRPKAPLKFDPPDLEVGTEWLEHALTEMKWDRGSESWTPEKFAAAVAKVRKATGLTHEGTKGVLSFIRGHKFWGDVALTPTGLLRKNEDGIRKIDTILVQMTKHDRKNARHEAMMNSEEDPF